MKKIWSCQECGTNHTKWIGSCTGCSKWNTLVEEVAVNEKKQRYSSSPTQTAKPKRIREIKDGVQPRLKTGMKEFDRLLGGGVVVGSLSLVGGDPGIGKSTLMMQISESLAKQGLNVLYICGEESIEQTSLRAKRLGVGSDNLFLLSETNFSHVKAAVDQLKPDVLIVDSIQILYKPELTSSPGSVTQVRELATEFMHLSKGHGISTFLIGHVTKSGEIAGPRVLEHIVDTVLDFDGNRQHGYRMLRATKNRFGSTDEIAIYQMEAEGLKEVANPSMLFLQERLTEVPGSCIVPTLEGSRAILIELQSLVVPSSYSTSTRKSTGVDANRLTLLLAVLEKRMGYPLSNTDVFVSVAGGMKIREPALDLGLLLSIASSFCNHPLDPHLAVFGEVGLSGEVRSVPRVESRLKEAIHMGFKRCLLPARNTQSLPKSLTSKIELVGVNLVEEAIRAAIQHAEKDISRV